MTGHIYTSTLPIYTSLKLYIYERVNVVVARYAILSKRNTNASVPKPQIYIRINLGSVSYRPDCTDHWCQSYSFRTMFFHFYCTAFD